MKWNLIKTDGNPPKEGECEVVLLHPDKIVTQNGKEKPAEDTKYSAFIDMRFYGRKWPMSDFSWAMIDQDENAEFYWHEQSGSCIFETVYAWLDKSDMPLPDLPDGVVWEEDC